MIPLITKRKGFYIALVIKKLSSGHNRRGYVAMSNSGQEDTNHSQFYIIMKRTAYLNGEYVVFGKVIDGWVRLSVLEIVRERVL